MLLFCLLAGLQSPSFHPHTNTSLAEQSSPPVEMEAAPPPPVLSDSGQDDHDVLDVALIVLNTDYTTCQDPSYSNLEAVKEDGRMMKEMLRSSGAQNFQTAGQAIAKRHRAIPRRYQ